MFTRHAPTRVALAWQLLLLAAVGCATCPPVPRQVVSGHFSGTDNDGKAIALTLNESDGAFQGEGSIAGQPVMLAGAVGWRGVATVVDDKGTQRLVRLELSADGERLLVEPPGGVATVLDRGQAAPTTVEPGPFSGSYRARRQGATLGEATLVQHGTLLTGVARIAGDAAGISGQASGSGAARGLVTFLDGTQVDFAAELSADRQTLTLRGFGQPLALERTSAP